MDGTPAVKENAFIVVDEEIKGGTPVIRGTRLTVYAVLGRIDHGETIDDILADNPDLTREALEAASCECYRVVTRLLQAVTNGPRKR